MNQEATYTFTAPHPVGLASAVRSVKARAGDVVRIADNPQIAIVKITQSEMLLDTVAVLEADEVLQLGEVLQFELPRAGRVEAKIEGKDGCLFLAVFNTPISRAAMRSVISAPIVEFPYSSGAVFDEAKRAHHQSKPIAEWVMWLVLSATAIVVFLFLFSLSSLAIN